MQYSCKNMERKAAKWLRQGISPRRLALTLALGFTIGCVPVVGLPTVACTAIALALGLNLPAIQAANYAATPFQLALIVPFLKLGVSVVTFGTWPLAVAGRLAGSPVLKMAAYTGGMAIHALLGWALVAAPAAVIMTLILTAALRRVPALKEE